ncbi:carboxypeptidase-like regulatory domain-containing protein [bacterium]|nr:carboxypeptidase-like regulatory domain-containing protein [bacterium]
MTDISSVCCLFAEHAGLRTGSLERDYFELHVGERHGPVKLILQEGTLLTVAVLDAETLQPIADADVLTDVGDERRTNEEGQAHFEGLPSREWQVQVLANGYALKRMTGRLIDGEPMTLVAEMEQGGTLYGKVTDSMGNPVQAATVAQYHNGSYVFIKATQTSTDQDGNYRIGNLALDTTLPVMITAHGFRDLRLTQENLRLTEKEPKRQFDVVLQPEALVTGRVHSPDRKPIVGADVILNSGSMHEIKTQTDYSGEFRFENAQLGEFGSEIMAMADGYAVAIVDLRTPEDAVQAEPLEIILEQEHWVGGHVEDPDDNPAQGVWVIPVLERAYARTQLLPLKVETDASGRFEVHQIPSDTTFSFIDSTNELSMKFGVALNLNSNENRVRLNRTGAIQGSAVSAEDGTPIERFNVKISPSNAGAGGIEASRIRRGVEFDSPSGKFLLGGLDAGELYDLTITQEGCPPAIFTTVLATEDQADDTVDYAVSCDNRRYSGKVLDEEGNPIGGAEVRGSALEVLRSRISDSQLWENGTLDPHLGIILHREVTATSNDGGFTLSEMPPNAPIDLSIRASGFADKRVQGLEDFSDEEAQAVRVALDREATITGRILDPEIASKTEVGLWKYNDDGIVERMGNLQGAEFRFTGLAAGEYLVNAQPIRLPAPAGAADPSRAAHLREAKAGRWNGSRRVELEAGEQYFMEVAGPDSHRVSGRALAGNVPMSNANIALLPPVEGLVRYHLTRTDGEGRFLFEHVDPESYQLIALGAEPAEFGLLLNTAPRLQFELGTTDIDRDFIFPPVGSIRGRLIGRGGISTSFLFVRTDAPVSEMARLGVEPEEDGSFEVTSVTPGPYELISYDGQTGNSWRVLEGIMMPDPPQDLALGDIPLGGRGEIRIRVADDETNRAGFAVAQESADDTIPPVATSVGAIEGLTLAGLEPGEYLVSAGGSGWVSAVPAKAIVEAGRTCEVSMRLRVTAQVMLVAEHSRDYPVQRVEVTETGGGRSVPVQRLPDWEILNRASMLPRPAGAYMNRLGVVLIDPDQSEHHIEMWAEDGHHWEIFLVPQPGERIFKTVSKTEIQPEN